MNNYPDGTTRRHLIEAGIEPPDDDERNDPDDDERLDPDDDDRWAWEGRVNMPAAHIYRSEGVT